MPLTCPEVLVWCVATSQPPGVTVTGVADRVGEVVAVVLAGGSGSRLGAPQNKVYLPLAGRPVLSWSLRAFLSCPDVDRVVLVARPSDRDRADEAIALAGEPGSPPRIDVIAGGANRHDSEWSALSHLAEGIRAGRTEVVLIHDGARPLVRSDLISAVIGAARETGSAVPGVAVDGVVQRDENGRLRTVGPPGRLVRVQTPQGFLAGPLLAAYERADVDGFAGTDTAASVERYAGQRVRIVPGDPRNLKITYPPDLVLAERLLTARGR